MPPTSPKKPTGGRRGETSNKEDMPPDEEEAPPIEETGRDVVSLQAETSIVNKHANLALPGSKTSCGIRDF